MLLFHQVATRLSLTTCLQACCEHILLTSCEIFTCVVDDIIRISQKWADKEHFGGVCIFVYSCSARRISFESDCFYGMWTWIYEYTPSPPPRLSRLVTALNLISVNALFFLEQFKAFKQAMIKHSQAQDDYKVPSFISHDKRGWNLQLSVAFDRQISSTLIFIICKLSLANS
jgi:hypothetical protein